MANDVFTHIMKKFWRVDLDLEVPYVEKWVNKTVILKAIEESKAPSASPSYNLWVLWGT